MGLTSQSTGINVFNDSFIEKNTQNDLVIALAGNPNVGKSTVFNSLTGLNQHTGNWPGKTVANAQGSYSYKDRNYILVDIPGTYSIMSSSVEEEVARNFICFGDPDATVVVADATCLERNLNLVLQILEITDNVVVCVNLLDEAKRKKIRVDINELSEILGVPVVGTSAANNSGLENLMEEVHRVAVNQAVMKIPKVIYNEYIEEAISYVEGYVRRYSENKLSSRWTAIKLIDGEPSLILSLNEYLCLNIENNNELLRVVNNARNLLAQKGIDSDTLRDNIVSAIVHKAENICKKVVSFDKEKYNSTDRKIDSILTSKIFGVPIMLGMLAIILWLTITGANYPSKLLGGLLFYFEDLLYDFFVWINAPNWLYEPIVFGIYRTLAWVVSVMLPPMAIFFPLFTILEDLGYLPRIAFNLDNFFKKACSHGKQALTMCMGFGCNAAGVIGCRIIDSPRERLIAIITNNFVPCNGRFPTLITISTIFFGSIVAGSYKSIISTLAMVFIIVLGVFMTLFVSKLLSKTILKGLPSSFTLELPPYRKPQIGRILVRSIYDRTLFVLGRAASVAAPAGLIIWLMANVNVEGLSLLSYGANFLDPFARSIGLDGYILLAFILGFPANEIVVPIIIMSYMASGSLTEFESLGELRNLLVSHGWTWLTAVCVMLFSLMHFPCGTTLWTIRKETQSLKWTFLSFIIPTLTGILVCFIITQTVSFLGLI